MYPIIIYGYAKYPYYYDIPIVVLLTLMLSWVFSLFSVSFIVLSDWFVSLLWLLTSRLASPGRPMTLRSMSERPLTPLPPFVLCTIRESVDVGVEVWLSAKAYFFSGKQYCSLIESYTHADETMFIFQILAWSYFCPLGSFMTKCVVVPHTKSPLYVPPADSIRDFSSRFVVSE